MSKVCRRFNDFKAKLVSGFITFSRKRSDQCKATTPDKIWKHINPTDWATFVKRKMDPEIQVCSFISSKFYANFQ